MATVIKSPLYLSGQGGPAIVTKVEFSLDVAGAAELENQAIAHGGPSGQIPDEIVAMWTALPNKAPIAVRIVSHSTTNNTSTLSFYSEADNLGSATGVLLFKFYDAA